jgi:hypothetical protein
MDPSRCPGCGGLIGDGEHVRLAGARIHAECLQVCRDEPPGGGLPVA